MIKVSKEGRNTLTGVCFTFCRVILRVAVQEDQN